MLFNVYYSTDLSHSTSDYTGASVITYAIHCLLVSNFNSIMYYVCLDPHEIDHNQNKKKKTIMYSIYRNGFYS